MKIFRLIQFSLSKRKSEFFTFLILSTLSWSINIIMPYIIGDYIDNLINVKAMENIYRFTLISIILTIFAIISSYLSNMKKVKIVTNISYDLKEKLLLQLTKTSQIELKKKDAAYLSQRIFSDTEEISSFFITNSIGIVIQVLSIIIVGFMLFKIDWLMSLVLMIFVPIYIISYLAFKKPLYEKGYSVKEEENIFFSDVSYKISNIYFIKLNSLYQNILTEVREKYEKLYNIIMKFTKLAYIFSSLGSTINNLAKIALIFIGGVRIISGNLTIGEFTIMSSYFAIFIGAVNYFLELGKTYQSALICLNRIGEVSTLEKESNGNELIGHIDDIELKNVSFSYNGNGNIFKPISYLFEKGNIYCIVGENGSGKSTLINVILNIYNNYQGEVFINNKSIKNIDMICARRDLFSVAEQNPALFESNLEANLKYSIDNCDLELLNYYVEAFKLYNGESRSNLSEKKVNKKNDTISGGEKQKVSLIRALLKDSHCLILDEPSTYLDEDGMNALKKILYEVKDNKIVIIVTHDDKIRGLADYVFSVNK
ncbi:MAG: ABC transporter ATP-binding protein [Clostridium sulfidigenes]|uniref:ABC transporter ATP-binding protein n=1 Tax=Clostridium sulfidigenes TaxID=318464 RepID=A0A927W8J6_9CLOT|nr:ABC transporter ATP-binding protein [Clostridium sulfidigenes]